MTAKPSDSTPPASSGEAARDLVTSVESMILNNKAEASRAILARAFEEYTGDIAVVSSFGADSVVLLDLVAHVDCHTPVLFLDTGRHFPETLGYAETVMASLGLSDVRHINPDSGEVVQLDPRNERAGYDPDGCCDLRKVRPLARALAPFRAWVSGRKRFQADTRAALSVIEHDGAHVKINPMYDWTPADLEAWRLARNLPQHPLVTQGYPSIGCAPCTARVAPGDDPRAGRWSGFAKTECGIHKDGSGI